MSAERILDLLRARGRTLAIAESLTGGLLTDAFVRVPGASAVVNGGVIAYATPVKATLLGVDAGLLDQHGPVHPDVARRMAVGARRALAVDGRDADVGIATTGVAGPEPQGGRPVGTVFIGIAAGSTATSVELRLAGDRMTIRVAAVGAALEALLAVLDRAE